MASSSSNKVQGKHWKRKVELGEYRAPAGTSKAWKERFEAVHAATTSRKLIKADEMPWLDLRFAQNAFAQTRFTGRYLWLKLTALARMKYLTLQHGAPEEGFFGILSVELPASAVDIFNETPLVTRGMHGADRKARKTNDRCWRTCGFVERPSAEADGGVVWAFVETVAATISEQNSRSRHQKRGAQTNDDDDEPEPEPELEEDEGVEPCGYS